LAYNIEYDPKVFKQLSKLDKTEVKAILDKIEYFADEPMLTQIKKLKTPFDGAYRLRAGNYRVVFYLENDLMLISKIAHRKNVYDE
jgi:mRNA interferase RelE/StbE